MRLKNFEVKSFSHSILERMAALCVVASIPSIAHSQIVACDLVDQKFASTLLQSPIKQHSPNRQIQTVGVAANSNCIFFAERSNLRAQLFDYPSQPDAARAFREASSGGTATYAVENGLGDEAAWWSIGTEAHGYLVRKGKRLFILDSRWHDSMPSVEAKARLKPTMPLIMSKL